jgi:hypothetical protein
MVADLKAQALIYQLKVVVVLVIIPELLSKNMFITFPHVTRHLHYKEIFVGVTFTVMIGNCYKIEVPGIHPARQILSDGWIISHLIYLTERKSVNPHPQDYLNKTNFGTFLCRNIYNTTH